MLQDFRAGSSCKILVNVSSSGCVHAGGSSWFLFVKLELIQLEGSSQKQFHCCNQEGKSWCRLGLAVMLAAHFHCRGHPGGVGTDPPRSLRNTNLIKPMPTNRCCVRCNATWKTQLKSSHCSSKFSREAPV